MTKDIKRNLNYTSKSSITLPQGLVSEYKNRIPEELEGISEDFTNNPMISPMSYTFLWKVVGDTQMSKDTIQFSNLNNQWFNLNANTL